MRVDLDELAVCVSAFTYISTSTECSVIDRKITGRTAGLQASALELDRDLFFRYLEDREAGPP